jgi:gliding motility-associated-like protein
MYIFDRWGKQVFATTELSLGWDGYINGIKAPMTVYTYTLSYRNTAGEKKTKSGVVTLLR